MLRSALHRRSFLKASAGALAASMGGTAAAVAGEPTIELPADHREALNRRRCRIVVQYDCQTEFALDFDSWIAYRFAYADEPGTQIDALWWDMGRLGNVFYPSKLLNQLKNPALEKWRRQGIDLVGRLVEETRKRKLEVFWHHRVSEVDLDAEGAGAAWQSGPDPLKRAHPDWVLRTWWKHGLWNFAVPQVRQLTVDSLREVAERYDLDGVQIDFARHIPCLPPGRQWELRHHVTELMRMARRMLLEVARRRGRPILLAAKVPRNLAGCRVDGLDVETWARQRLVDIFTLGSRSMDVDVGGVRRITAGSDIRAPTLSRRPPRHRRLSLSAHRTVPRRLRQLVAGGGRRRGDFQLVQCSAGVVPQGGRRARAARRATGIPRSRPSADATAEGQDVCRGAAGRIPLGRRLFWPQ